MDFCAVRTTRPNQLRRGGMAIMTDFRLRLAPATSIVSGEIHAADSGGLDEAYNRTLCHSSVLDGKRSLEPSSTECAWSPGPGRSHRRCATDGRTGIEIRVRHVHRGSAIAPGPEEASLRSLKWVPMRSDLFRMLQLGVSPVLSRR